MTIQERFESHIEPITVSGCWLWMSYTTKAGYGRFKINGKMDYAHRVAYKMYKGQIPKGLQIDHLCRVRGCCNPDHLEAVTCKENNRRGWYGVLWRCKNGHDTTRDENVIKKKTGGRRCRVCHNDWLRNN